MYWAPHGVGQGALIALRNLRRNPVRSGLTLAGAAVGIAVFVALTSISVQVKAGLRAVVAAYEGDVSVQTARAATPPGSRIPEADLEGLRRLAGVEAVTPVVMGSVHTPWSPFFLLFGAPEPLADRLSLTRGRTYRNDAAELLLGETAYRTIGAEVGETVVLAGREFTVVGTYAIGAPMVDGAAVTHLMAAQELLDQPGIVNLALLRVRPGYSAGQVVEAVRRAFPRFRATRGADLIGQLQLFRTVNTFARALSLVGLLAACLVVTNTLLMAVWERTREIGILRAVGWSKARIVRSLVAESLFLCALSGLLGNFMALLFLRAVNGTGGAGLGWIPVVVPAEVFWTSLVISGLLGLVSALYPAVVSAALSPAQALRHE